MAFSVINEPEKCLAVRASRPRAISWAGSRTSSGHSRLICLARCPEVFIKPVDEAPCVLADGEPAVACALLDDELGLDSGFVQPIDHQLRLLERDQAILIAVDEECGGIIGRDVVDRGDLA